MQEFLNLFLLLQMLINATYYQTPTSAIESSGESVYQTSGNDSLLVLDDKNKCVSCNRLNNLYLNVENTLVSI